MKYDALLVIDVQTALIEAHPHNEEIFIDTLINLIKASRDSGIPVIYIRHDGLGVGSDGWQIYEKIKPLSSEKIIDKHYNSAFRKTDLDQYLKSKGAKNIIICGIKTDYCIDAACKVAFEYEYNVTVVHEATTTTGSDYMSAEKTVAYYESIWNKRYAEVLPAQQVIQAIKDGRD